MSDLALPIVLMLLLVIAEAIYLQRSGKQKVNWRDVVFNLNSGHMMLWLFRGVEIACFGYVAANFSLGWLDSWPTVCVWLFAILAWDFGFYWLHRLHHHWRLFWAVHVVHHQGEHYNLSLGVRNSWYSSLTSIPFFLILAVMGLPLSVFISVSIFHYTIQFFNHNEVTPKLGILEKIFVTPTHHRVHHVKDLAYSNKNFGGSFIFWDKMFGSFQGSLPSEPFSYGVKGAKASDNPFWASNQPFIRYFKLPVSLSERAAQFHSSSVSLVSGCIVLFALVIGYVYTYGYSYSDISWPQAVLFILLAVGAIALSGISEGRTWGIYSWSLISLVFPLLFIGYFGWSGLYWLVLMPLIAAHGIAIMFGWGRTPLVSAGEPYG